MPYWKVSLYFCLLAILLTPGMLTIARPLRIFGDTSHDSWSVQKNDSQQIITRNNLEAKILADNLYNTINNSASILDMFSTLSDIKNLPYVNSINVVFHGIPQNLDLAKRNIADTILSKYKYFGRIFFLLPNGNVYLIEPFSGQQNLTVNNLSFRDYYKGALATHHTYLGGESISLTSHHKTAVIAVPIYSSSGKLSEIWGGALELSVFDKSLQALNLTQMNQHVVYVDQHGNKIADSNQSTSNNSESFAILCSFKNAMQGKDGSVVELVNNTKMIISYHPVKFASTTWVVLLMQAY